MRIAAIAAMMLLAGCATTMPASTAIKYKYIVNTIPVEMFEVPPQVEPIDTKIATDRDAANWMLESEKRYQEIEKRLAAIKTFLEEKMKNLKVPPEDVILN